MTSQIPPHYAPQARPKPLLKQYATVLKTGAIMVLALLLIPLTLVHSVLSERLAYRNEAINAD